ncbi:MAG: sulfotransferase [Planctomycetota bacterium]
MAHRLPPSFSPRDPRALLQQGIACHRSRDFASAEGLYRRVLQIEPGNVNALVLLASACLALDRPRDALQSIRRALKLDDRRPDAHATLGNVQFALGEFGRARDAFRRAIAGNRQEPGHHFGLGLALERLGEIDAAIAAYSAGIEVAPADPRLRINLGTCLLSQGALDLAVEHLAEATRLAPNMLAARLNLAGAYRELGDYPAAIENYRAALKIAPTDPRGHATLGQVFREAGQIEAAIRSLQLAIDLAPSMAEPRITLAMTRNHVGTDEHTEWIESAAREPAAVGAKDHDVWFAHAKVLEDLGKPTESFEQLARANAARRETIDFDIGKVAESFARVRQVFTRERQAAWAAVGCADPTPIFIVGLPRSGTSLVEQILASHSQVHGLGETTIVQRAFEALDGGYPEAFETIRPEALHEVGASIVEQLRRRARTDARNVVDKLPMNFTRLGAIRAVLPNATVLHCIRDERDVGYSIFRQNFERDVGFAFDLAEIGDYIKLYRELMDHWRSVLDADSFLEIRYEHLVANLESETRRILDRCELPFEPQCLEFHRTERGVKTASLQQVRRPVYRSSIGAWRRHADRLRPLLDRLE